MGLFRKTMSLSTAGLINWRDESERQAAAERSKSKAYRERTKMMQAEARADRAAMQHPLARPNQPVQPSQPSLFSSQPIAAQPAQRAWTGGPPPGFYKDPDGGPDERWWDGAKWTDVRR